MFSTVSIEKNTMLEDIVVGLLKDREFGNLRDNDINIGVYLYINSVETGIPGRIVAATELEKLMGYDVVIYINSSWFTYSKRKDIESYMYQQMLSIDPMIVGNQNQCIVKINKEIGIMLNPKTVDKYGKDISWYKDLYQR